jgi:hypothetical protein
MIAAKTIDAANSIASSLSAYSAQEQALIASHASVDERLRSVLAEHPGAMTDNPLARASAIPPPGCAPATLLRAITDQTRVNLSSRTSFLPCSALSSAGSQ